MKIAIYGGSFNPFHLGHEKIVNYVIEKLNLDLIIIIPVGIPSHRENNLEKSDTRLLICEKIFEDNPKVIISNIEIINSAVSYTYDTLIKLMKIYPEKDNEFFEIVGQDSIEYFERWKNYKEILEISKVVVLKRKTSKSSKEKLKHKNIIYLDNPLFNFSSTEIRERVKKKLSIKNMVNEKVRKIIEKEYIDNI